MVFERPEVQWYARWKRLEARMRREEEDARRVTALHAALADPATASSVVLPTPALRERLVPFRAGARSQEG